MGVHVETIRAGHMDNLSYILRGEGPEAMVIDPSFAAKDLWSRMQQEGLELEHIFCTHGHFDHSKGAFWLSGVSGGKVAVHEGDLSMLEKRPHLILRDGDVLSPGDVEIQVLHTPGHTPGGICLLSRGVLFTGDTLFVGNCGRTDLAGGSDRDLFNSLQRLKALDESIVVYPGHSYGGATCSTIGREKKTNPALLAKTLAEFLRVP